MNGFSVYVIHRRFDVRENTKLQILQIVVSKFLEFASLNFHREIKNLKLSQLHVAHLF